MLSKVTLIPCLEEVEDADRKLRFSEEAAQEGGGKGTRRQGPGHKAG